MFSIHDTIEPRLASTARILAVLAFASPALLAGGGCSSDASFDEEVATETEAIENGTLGTAYNNTSPRKMLSLASGEYCSGSLIAGGPSSGPGISSWYLTAS